MRIRKYLERNNRYPGCWYYLSADSNDKIYYVTYKRDGKKITAKFGRHSEGKTLAACSHWRSFLIKGKEKPPQEKRREAREAVNNHIHPLFELYMEGKKSKQDVSRYIKYVYPFWIGKDITKASNIDAANYRKWLERQEKKEGGKLSPQTVKHCIGLFRRIVKYAKTHIHEFVLLIDDFKVPKVSNKVTEDLTDEQLKKLIHVLRTDQVNRPVCSMLLLILNTGLRHGEVLKLQWQHVNFERKIILINNPKGKVNVKINMNWVVEEIIKSQSKISMYIFPGKDGKKRAHIRKAARRLIRLAGIPDDFRQCHGLRHFYGTELAANGIDVKTISSLMGHKNLDATNRYLEAREGNKILAVNHMAFKTGGQKWRIKSGIPLNK